MFKELDTIGDQKIGLEEFKMAVPTLGKWRIKITYAEASFKEIDVNGGEVALFDEITACGVELGEHRDDIIKCFQSSTNQKS